MSDVESGKQIEMQTAEPTYKAVEVEEIKPSSTIRGREDKDYKTEFSLHGLSKFWTSICRVEIGPAVQITAQDKKEFGCFACIVAWLDNTFRITDRGSTFYLEIVGGFTTFFTIAYILTLNPIILEPTGIPNHASFFTTALTSGVFTTLMGLVTNLPVAMGPSLGLNFFFREIAETCAENPTGDLHGATCGNWGKTTLPWSDALGAVYISGWFYLAITVTGFRSFLYDSIPKSLRYAIACGTGFFITMQALKIGAITRVTVQPQYLDDVFAAAGCSHSPSTGLTCSDPVNLGQRWYNIGIAHFHQVPAARIAVIGIVIASALELYKWKGSLIISIWIATLIGINYYQCNSEELPAGDADTNCVTDLHIWTGNPAEIPFIVDWSNNPAGRLTFKYANTGFFWQCVWTFLFFELFDSYGALEGIVTRMGLTKNAPTVSMDRINRAMFIDGLGVWLGAVMGTNSMNVYIESNTGVVAGARTGLASIVTGSCLLLCLLFVYPFVSIIPACATTGALVMIGVYSMLEYRHIDFTCYINRLTAFFTIAIMGFTYSITNGICVGCIFYCWLQIAAVLAQYVGINAKEIRAGTEVKLPHPFLILMSVFMACRFAFLGQN